MPKSCKKSLRNEAKTTNFAALNRILRLIFIYFIQSFLYTICIICIKAHTKNSPEKAEKKHA